MLSLVALLAVGQLNPPMRFLEPNTQRRTAPGAPFFEFAPSSGAGMGAAACACTAVTGSKGEVLTFARATSVGVCIKSNSKTAIANGDLVSCAADLPRVMPGFDGTSVNGLLTEPARTNLVVQSRALDNAAFANFVGIGGTNPTLDSADATTDPLGTTEADAYTFAATTGTQSSARSTNVATAAVYSGGYFVKGQAGSGTIDVCIQTSVVPAATCVACAYTNTAWNWCTIDTITSIASGNIYVGNLTSLNGGTARASNAVYVWQVDLQAGEVMSTPILTAGAAATRNAETAIFNSTNFATGDGSLAATFVYRVKTIGAVVGSSGTSHGMQSTADGRVDLFIQNVRVINGAVMTSGSHRIAGFWGSAGTGLYTDATFTSGAAASITTARPIRVGDSYAGGTPPIVTKMVCYDMTSGRCR